MAQEFKTTPLHNWHLGQKANLAEFGGYEMPLWYASAKTEHQAVLTSAGLFDTSHMAGIKISGPNSKALLQKTFSRDLNSCLAKGAPLKTGRCVYGVFLNSKGHVLDDAVLYKQKDEEFLLVVNAGMGGPITEHLMGYASPETQLEDLTDRLGKIDLQGPKSALILSKLLQSPDEFFTSLPYFSFKGQLPMDSQGQRPLLKGFSQALISRSGYTGELGFEIFISPEETEALWNKLFEAGEEYALQACGLAARDSLRAGAVLPLSHQDIGDWKFINTPWDLALPFNQEKSAFSKDFVGAAALLSQDEPTYTYPLLGKDLRKVAAGKESAVYDPSDRLIGHVLTCATDMGVGLVNGQVFSLTSPNLPADFKPKGLCCGFVLTRERLEAGQEVTLADQKRKLKVQIVQDIRPDRTARKPLRNFL